MKKAIKKIAGKIKSDQERAARKTLLEQLFIDLNRSRFQVYKINFVRGLFFGLGSVLGGTVVIAMLVWILAALSQYIPILSDSFETLRQILETAKR